MAAPFVSGAAAVLWSIHPKWTSDQIRDRLVKTAKPMPGLQLGAGRLDLFEAVFNGSFESGTLDEWTKPLASEGIASVLGGTGPMLAADGEKLASLSPSSPSPSLSSKSSKGSTINHKVAVQPGVNAIPIRLKYDYAFGTKNYVANGTDFELFGGVSISIITPKNKVEDIVVAVFDKQSNSLIHPFDLATVGTLSPLVGFAIPNLGSTVQHTGWLKAEKVIDTTVDGPGIYQLNIACGHSFLFDTTNVCAVLFEHIEFRDDDPSNPVPGSPGAH